MQQWSNDPLSLTGDGDTFHLRLFSGSDDEEGEKLSKKWVRPCTGTEVMSIDLSFAGLALVQISM